jgi:hypothetical protein
MRGFGGFLTNLVTGDSETGQKLAHFLGLKTLAATFIEHANFIKMSFISLFLHTDKQFRNLVL